MSNVKDNLYEYFVRKDKRIQYEYEKHVMNHMDEHKCHRIRHWFFFDEFTFSLFGIQEK